MTDALAPARPHVVAEATGDAAPSETAPASVDRLWRGRGEFAWRPPARETTVVRLARHEPLVRSGDRFRGLYIVHAGACKLVCLTPGGQEHIAAFCLPGEAAGLEALATGVHEVTVEALEPTTLWHLCASRVDALLRDDAAFARALTHALSLEVGRGLRRALLLGTMSAEQRVASLLLDLADRGQRPGVPGTAVELPMTRVELGSHLGLSTETVSRVLSRLHAARLAIVNGRSVHLRDRVALARILLHAR